MLILLFTILGLMFWSTRLMIVAFRQHDFSFLFAGTLVALSAAGIVVVYSLMNGCMGYLGSNDSTWVSSSSGFSAVSDTQLQQTRLNFPNNTLWIEEIPHRG